MKYKNVFGIVGWKNSGKTILVENLVKNITDQGYKVSTIKHAHHSLILIIKEQIVLDIERQEQKRYY